MISEAATGRVILQTALQSGRNKLMLDKFNIESGLYICTIAASDGTTKQFKLVNMK